MKKINVDERSSLFYSTKRERFFITLTTGPNVIKLFMVVNYKCYQYKLGYLSMSKASPGFVLCFDQGRNLPEWAHFSSLD